MPTTVDTITSSQISKLSHEATAAGDEEMVAICFAALAGGSEAKAECAKVIRAAEANGGATYSVEVMHTAGHLEE